MSSKVDPAWKLGVLSDLVQLQRGHDLPEQRRHPGTVCVMGSAGLSGYHDEAKVRGPGLVLGRSGASFGKVHYSQADYWPLNTALFATDFLGNDPRFVYFTLKTIEFSSFNSGSAQPSLNRNFIADIPIGIPPLAEQQRIVWLLDSFDNKIDSNRRLAKLLEETAATMFHARFVDFVGVKDLEESEIGPIPRGWKCVSLSDVIELNPHVPIVRGTSVPFLEMANTRPWATRPHTMSERPYKGGARFERGDILMARITGCIEHGKGAFVDFIDTYAAGSTEFLVLRPRPPLTSEAVFFVSRTDRVRERAIASMTGSSGRQRVSVDALANIQLAIPVNQDSWSDLALFMRTSLERTRAIWRESRTLTALRDTLLPKLISGEIRIPDTKDPEEVIGPAAEQLAQATT